MSEAVTPRQFAFFRMALGAYLMSHFLYLIPYGTEVFSSAGMLPEAGANLTWHYFPDLLRISDAPWAITFLLGLGAALSGLLASGYGRPGVSALLWFVWACLFHRNNLVHTPAVPYVGWLLLACVVIPSGEPRLGAGGIRPADPAWKFPTTVFLSAWLLLGLGYTLSGFDKLWSSSSWSSGDSVAFILETPLARDNFLTRALLGAPELVQHLLTWSTVSLELLFGLACVWKRTRQLAWAAMVSLHLSLLVTIDFAELTIGMLLVHAFTYDARWVWRLPLLRRG